MLRAGGRALTVVLVLPPPPGMASEAACGLKSLHTGLQFWPPWRASAVAQHQASCTYACAQAVGSRTGGRGELAAAAARTPGRTLDVRPRRAPGPIQFGGGGDSYHATITLALVRARSGCMCRSMCPGVYRRLAASLAPNRPSFRGIM